jgi:site-specific recombinase XerD
MAQQQKGISIMNSLTHPNPPYYAVIESAPLSDGSKDKYKRELDKLSKAGVDPRNQEALRAYAADLPHSSKAILKAALSIMFDETTTRLEASARPDNLNEVQATLLNLKAMDKVLRTRKQKGQKLHLWLSREQVEQITSIPDIRTSQGRRDWIVLATLLGAGLRRSEMASTTFENIKKQPMRNGQMRAVIELIGKGGKPRVIPIQPLLEKRLIEWHNEVGDGYIARSVNKSGTINGSLSDHAVNDIVGKYGAMIALPELEAHDCRRTFARLGYEAGVTVEQISKLLGHESIETTMNYLGLDIDVESTVSDFIPLKG